MNGRKAEWISALVAVFVLLGAILGVYVDSSNEGVAQGLRIAALEERVTRAEAREEALAEKVESEQKALRQRLDVDLGTVRQQIGRLNTNTVLICEKLQIERCQP